MNLIKRVLSVLMFVVFLAGGLYASLMPPDTLTTPPAIGNWIKNNINYFPDYTDHWQPAPETLDRGAGDCEDFAILAQYLLRKIGIESQIVYFTVDRNLEFGAHVICVFKEGEVYNYIGTENYRRVNGKTIQDVCNFSANRAGAIDGKTHYIEVMTDADVQRKIEETKNDF